MEGDNQSIYRDASAQLTNLGAPVDSVEVEVQGGPRSEHRATPLGRSSLAVQPAENIVNGHVSNIIIFGETGVGKSSIINLIADRDVARTSNAALGCTFTHERYTFKLDGVTCNIWDTTGLEEGTQGTVPADVAEKNLRSLIEELARTGGIHLVIYCTRGSRLTRALKRNYDLFYVAVCRKKAPVALVVTGLEHQEGRMEEWWYANEDRLRQSGMLFDAHACVTTLGYWDQTVQDRRRESQECLRKLVLEYARHPPWKIKPSFLSRISSTLHGVLMKASANRSRDIKIIRKVVIYDMATNHQSFIQVSPGIALHQRLRSMIGDKEYEFIRLDKRAMETELRHEEGAGVLVFYTSALADLGIPPNDVIALKTFCDNVGHTCPVIVVVQGCNDEGVARMLWDDATSHDSDIRADPTFRPTADPGHSDELNELIRELCIEHVEVCEPKAGELAPLLTVERQWGTASLCFIFLLCPGLFFGAYLLERARP